IGGLAGPRCFLFDQAPADATAPGTEIALVNFLVNRLMSSGLFHLRKQIKLKGFEQADHIIVEALFEKRRQRFNGGVAEGHLGIARNAAVVARVFIAPLNSSNDAVAE